MEIARAEHGDRASRHEHSSKIRLAVVGDSITSINHRFDPRSFANNPGEHAKLSARSCSLAGQPRTRNAVSNSPRSSRSSSNLSIAPQSRREDRLASAGRVLARREEHRAAAASAASASPTVASQNAA